ncbi:MAG: HEPN domain-containing protein [Bacteriovorax sp.]|nr:HEPN domain-containing protein [Bacteriovorax sp.]
MGRTKDIVREIAEVRERRRFGFAMTELVYRLHELEDSFKRFDKSNKELIRYYPVAIVACMEGYFRLAIKEIIDRGEPYISNAEKLASTIKIDFSVLHAVHGKEITVGELISHSVPLSRLDHIEHILSNLLGNSFLHGIRVTTDRYSHEIYGKPLVPILDNPDCVFASVNKIFELRHVICHELATAHTADYDEIAKYFQNGLSFMRAADELISETLNPGSPLTQRDMNIHSQKILEDAESRLLQLCESLQNELDDNERIAFDRAQLIWQDFYRAWAEVTSNFCEGGTMRPMVYNSECTAIIEKRILELTDYKKSLTIY